MAIFGFKDKIMARCEGKTVCLAYQSYQSDGTECSCLIAWGFSRLPFWPPGAFFSGAKLQRQTLPSSGATAYKHIDEAFKSLGTHKMKIKGKQKQMKK